MTCRYCKEEFVPTHKLQRYCNDSCKTKYNNAVAARRRKMVKEANGWTRKTCAWCGAEFDTRDHKRKYCPHSRCQAEHNADKKRKRAKPIDPYFLVRHSDRPLPGGNG